MLRLITFISALLFAGAAAATQLYVDAHRDGYLNLRGGPSTGYHVIAKMKHGSPIHVIAAPGKWYKVRDTYGSVGWAHSGYMTRDPKPIYKPAPVHEKLYVKAPGYSGLNLRHGPGTHYGVILTMKQGSAVKVLAKSGAWWKVKHQGGCVGWAHENYLTRHPQHVGHTPYQSITNWEAILQKCSQRPAHRQQRCVARHLGY